MLGLFMTLTSSGIPITVSRMMIKHKENGEKARTYETVSAGILTTLLISLPITFLVIFNVNTLGFLFTDLRCAKLLQILILGLSITSIYSVIRGSFWGENKFLTYSIIELLEEAVMLVFGIILITNKKSMLDGVEKATYAVVISYVFSFVASLSVYFICGGKLKSPKRELKPLVLSSTPITFMRSASSLINTLIAIILPSRLIKLGFNEANAVSEFGKIFGMAMPLIFIPSTIIGSLAIVLVPELSSNFYSKKYKTLKNNVEKALNFSTLIACLIIPVFLSCGNELGKILYHDEFAGAYVIKSAIITLPLSISLISTSMLNSLGKEKDPSEEL